MTVNNTILLRHICFTGPNKMPAELTFRKGLNVLYGASETGKSFVLEAIDFMLGGNTELRDIPERVGYDRVFLGIEINNDEVTLARATSGGNYQLYIGLHKKLPTDQQGISLSAKHNADNTGNVSNYLLTKIGLNKKRVKTNANGSTRNLSFRDVSHLCIIDENRIQKTGSPIETSGQYQFRTAEYSIFKLLLTGVDDSAIVANTDVSVVQNQNSKIELIDELIAGLTASLPGKDVSETELAEQLQKLDKTISDSQRDLNQMESSYWELITSKNNLRSKIDLGTNRRGEIDELLARFAILDDHYRSDLSRLEGIREAGSLISVLEVKTCPLCGALPDHQHPGEDSIGNLETIVTATNAESQKIQRLQGELQQTIAKLKDEATGYDKSIPSLKSNLAEIENQISELNKGMVDQRVSYTSLIDKRAEIRSILSIFTQITTLNDRKILLGKNNKVEGDPKQSPASKTVDLSTSVLDQFAQEVESILKAWNFPDSERVQFDEPSHDLIISGKRRGSRGKGMRSITHAAFMTSILEFCKNRKLAHPGFLVLDSPLLAYREPEDSDDDLRHTDVQDKFYEYLSKWSEGQVIIIENITPPDSIISLPSSIMFSKNDAVGRYGYFPKIDPPASQLRLL